MSQHMHREHAGQIVRRAWVEWAKRQATPKPSWLVPWEELAEPDREVDRQIGEAVIAGETEVRADYLVVQLGWEWEAFEREARHCASSVLSRTLEVLESPPTGDDRNDMLAAAAAKWIEDELIRRNGPVWGGAATTRTPTGGTTP